MECAVCRRTGAAFRCSACRVEHYCGAACQRTAWLAGHASACSAPLGFRFWAKEAEGGRLQRVGTLKDEEFQIQAEAPLYSFLVPPAEDVVVDDADDADVEEAAGMGTMLREWAIAIRRRVLGPTAAERDAELAAAEKELARAEAETRRRARVRAEKRLAEIRNHPIAYVPPQGIVVANFYGTHDAWERALADAVRASPGPLISMHLQVYRQKLWKWNLKKRGGVRPEVATAEFPHSPNPDAMSLALIKSIEKSGETRLRDVYILTNLPDEETVRALMQATANRLKLVFLELERAPRGEFAPWIYEPARDLLLETYRRGLFALVEFANSYSKTGMHPDAPRKLGYAMNLKLRDYALYKIATRFLPLASGLDPVVVALKPRAHTLAGPYYSINSLLLVALHECGHLLDNVNYWRVVTANKKDSNTLSAADPGHSDTFLRSFQYLLNLAVRAGVLPNVLVEKGASLVLENWDPQADRRQELLWSMYDFTVTEPPATIRRGFKRAREADTGGIEDEIDDPTYFESLVMRCCSPSAAYCGYAA
jgi:hypothetical protein